MVSLAIVMRKAPIAAHRTRTAGSAGCPMRRINSSAASALEANSSSEDACMSSRSPRNTPNRNAPAAASSVMSSELPTAYIRPAVQSKAADPASPSASSKAASLRVYRQLPGRCRLVPSQIPTTHRRHQEHPQPIYGFAIASLVPYLREQDDACHENDDGPETAHLAYQILRCRYSANAHNSITSPDRPQSIHLASIKSRRPSKIVGPMPDTASMSSMRSNEPCR